MNADTITLGPAPSNMRVLYTTDDCIYLHAKGGEFWAQRVRPGGRGRYGTWSGIETRIGSDGHHWDRHIRPLVHDDFGFLVEVPQ